MLGKKWPTLSIKNICYKKQIRMLEKDYLYHARWHICRPFVLGLNKYKHCHKLWKKWVLYLYYMHTIHSFSEKHTNCFSLSLYISFKRIFLHFLTRPIAGHGPYHIKLDRRAEQMSYLFKWRVLGKTPTASPLSHFYQYFRYHHHHTPP